MKHIIAILSLIVCAINVQAQGAKESYNITRAKEAIANQDFLSALAYADTEVKENPRNATAYAIKTYIFGHHNVYDETLVAATMALKHLPKKESYYRAACHGTRGMVYENIGDTAKAYAEYAAAITNNPSEPEYLFNLNNLLIDQDRWDDALPIIEKIKENFPNDARGNAHVGRYYDHVKNYDKAIEHYTYAVKLAPQQYYPFYYRAECYMHQRKWKEAADDIVAGLAVSIEDEFYEQLATMADSAYTQMSTALKIRARRDKENATWTYFLGLLNEYARRYTEACNNFEDFIVQNEYDEDEKEVAHKELAECYLNLGRFDKALESIDQAIANDSTYSSYYNIREEINYMQGLYDDAIADASHIIRLSPDDPYGYYERGFCNYLARRIDEALDDLDTVLILDPKDSAARLLRGHVNRLLGREAEAIADYEGAFDTEALYSKWVKASVHAAALSALGRFDEAIERLDKTFDRTTPSTTNNYRRARILAAAGRHDEAIAELEALLDKDIKYYYFIQNHPELKALQGNAAFAALIDKMADRTRRSDEPAESTAETTTSDTAELVVTEVPVTKQSGIYKVPCTVNGLPLNFFFDTGAADVTLSDVEANFMLKNGFLTKSDIKGSTYYGDANGTISEGTTIVLRKVEFGGLTLENVRASVVHNQQAPLLLGQTVLSRLGKIEIDYAQSKLIVTHKKQ